MKSLEANFFLKCVVEKIPDYHYTSDEWIEWCKSKNITPLNSDRRGWWDEAVTYIRAARHIVHLGAGWGAPVVLTDEELKEIQSEALQHYFEQNQYLSRIDEVD